jgi:hypothetical protein
MGLISFPTTVPGQDDSESVLLSKILQVLNNGGGGGGGGAGVSSISFNGGAAQSGAVSLNAVTSVNGDTGPAVLLDSGEIPEGANLYYTSARFDAAFAAKTTTNLAEGANLYYTQARFDAAFAAKTTTNLTEGANLYFTEARVRATVLTGLVSALGTITAADSVLSAFGKTEGRLAALEAGTAGPFVLRAGDTMTGALVITPSVANTVPLTLNAGSLTASTNVLTATATWNNAGVTFTGQFVNITDTNSAAGSLFFDWQRSSTSVFKLRKDGRLSWDTGTLTTGGAPAIFNLASTWNMGASNINVFDIRITDTASGGTGFIFYSEVSGNTRFTVGQRGTVGASAEDNQPGLTVATSKTGASAITGVSFTDTWNTSGNPAALKIQAVLTANGATSKLLYLVSGANPLAPSDKFYVLYDGSTWQAQGSTIVAGGQTISAGGLTLTTGNILVSSGNITITSGRLSTAVATLTDAATIATDASLANHFRVTLGGNRTLGNPTNAYDGARVVYEVIQDGTGNRTLAFDTNFAFGSDISSITLSTGANLRDFITVVYNSTATKWYVVAFVKGY